MPTCPIFAGPLTNMDKNTHSSHLKPGLTNFQGNITANYSLLEEEHVPLKHMIVDHKREKL